MATQTLILRSTQRYGSYTREAMAQAIKYIKHWLPRPCMMISTGLLVTGLCIPFLMGLTILPASLFLGFIGMALTCTGVVLTLYYL